MAVIIDGAERKFEFTILPLSGDKRKDNDPWRKIKVVFQNEYVSFEKCAESMTERELKDTVRGIDGYFCNKTSDYYIDLRNMDYMEPDYRFSFSLGVAFQINLPGGDSIRVYLKDEDLSAIRSEIANAIDMEGYVPPLSGCIKELTLISERGTNYQLREGEECSQSVNIKNGRWVNINYFDVDGKLLRSEDIEVDEDDFDDVLDDLYETMNGDRNSDIVYDDSFDRWKLTIINDKDEKFNYEGYMNEERLVYISDCIRYLIGRKRLMLFDGNVQEGIKFCSVEFGEGSQDYYYITDDESIEIDDLVKVPVGKNKRECIATVVDIEYFKEDDVPMSLDKVKKIICKYVPKEKTNEEKTNEEKADEDKEKDDK
jgi:hypothetical protein